MPLSTPTRATIVHPTDFSPGAASALAHALAITLASNSELRLLKVRENDQAFFSQTQGLREVRDLLVRWGRLPADAPYDHWESKLDLRVSSMSIAARSARAGILEYLADRPADLVVLGTSTQKAHSRWLDVSTPTSVLRQARIMSLFLREGGRTFIDPFRGALRLKKVLMPIDGAVKFIHALRRVERMKRLVSSDAVIQLFHVGERAPAATDERGKPLGMPVMLRQGRVVDSILQAAEDLHVDAIAMPTAGRHGVIDAMRGSTTARILEDCRWPLLAVPVG